MTHTSACWMSWSCLHLFPSLPSNIDAAPSKLSSGNERLIQDQGSDGDENQHMLSHENGEGLS